MAHAAMVTISRAVKTARSGQKEFGIRRARKPPQSLAQTLIASASRRLKQNLKLLRPQSIVTNRSGMCPPLPSFMSPRLNRSSLRQRPRDRVMRRDQANPESNGWL